MQEKRTIVIGDIHGCLEEFEELLNKLSYQPSNDRIILVGDLIDRGPDSLGVVRKARELKLECVMGNHEFKFLKWYKNKNSRSDVYGTYYKDLNLSQNDIDYLFKMPSYVRINNNLIIVHAGLKPGISLLSQSNNDLMYLRYTDVNGEFISLKTISKIGKEAAKACFWTEFWKGPDSVVYGHNVHSLDYPLIEEVAPNVTCYGIDTGCCFGGHLTSLILETKEIVQVKAKKEYFPPGFE